MRVINKRILYFVAVFIFIFEIYLHFSLITHRAFWTDELFTISYVKEGRSLAELLKIFITFEVTNPPLYDIFFYFWYRIVPHTEWILSLPSLIMFFVGVVLSAVFVRDVTRKNDLAAVLTLCILPLNAFSYTLLTAQIRSYSMMFMFSAAFLFMFFRTRENDSMRNVVITGIVIALLSFTHYFGALMVSYFGIIDIIQMFRKKIRIRNIVAYLIPLFTAGAWLLASILLKGRDVSKFWPETPDIKILIQTVSWLFGSKYLLIVTGVCVILVILGGITQKNMGKDSIMYILLGDIAFVLISVYVYSVYINPAGGFFVMRYFSVLLPVCAAVTMYAITELTKSFAERKCISILIFAAVFLLTLIPNIRPLLHYSFHGDMRKRITSDLLYDNYKDPKKDVVVLHNTDAFYRADGFKVFYMDGKKDYTIVEETDEKALREADRIFYVTLTYEDDLTDEFADIVKDHSVEDYGEESDLYIYSKGR